MEAFISKVWRRWMAKNWWRSMEIWHVARRWRETGGKWRRRVTIVRRVLFAVAWGEAGWGLIWRWWICLHSGRLILLRKRNGTVSTHKTKGLSNVNSMKQFYRKAGEIHATRETRGAHDTQGVSKIGDNRHFHAPRVSRLSPSQNLTIHLCLAISCVHP